MTTATAAPAPPLTLPAGSYAIADPCILLTDSEWFEFDLLRDVNPSQESFTLANGSRLVVISTNGDRWMFDQESFSYVIDSGSIAIRAAADVPSDRLARLDDGSWEADTQPIGAIHQFEHPFEVSATPATEQFAAPVIRVGHLTIA
jgi:hypothetical protein